MLKRNTARVAMPDVLAEVIEAVETLRLRRQEALRTRSHPLGKRFTQQELADEACPTYKNWLVGRSHRVPSRQTILDIAAYLECSATERNALLLAARYLPDSLELNGVQLRHALLRAEQVMTSLPYPAMVVTHTLHVEAINGAFQQLFGFPALRAIPREQRHVLHFACQHSLPLRARSTFNAQAVQIWQAGIVRSIDLLRRSNVLAQDEAWYHALVEQLCTIPEVRQYWGSAPAPEEQADTPAKLVLGRHATSGVWLPMQLRHVRIAVGVHAYPCVMALLPLDAAARSVYASFGYEATNADLPSAI